MNKQDYFNFKSFKGEEVLRVGETTYSVTLYGESSQSNITILQSILSGKEKSIPGDFVFVAQDESNEVMYLLTSRISATPFYYAKDSDFHAGTSVYNILANCKTRTKLNLKVVPFLFLQEHLFNEHTLDSNIKRIPANSLLTYKNNQLKIKEFYAKSNIRLNNLPN